jgi:proteasome lid subunit RPN8/RPN11
MSKKSKERKRLMRLAREAAAAERDTKVNHQPVTGDMAARVSTIVKTEVNGGQVGHVDTKVDSRLPVHYGGYHSDNQWQREMEDWRQQHNIDGNSNGYKPIDAAANDDIFRVVSTDVMKECPIAAVPKVYVPARLWHEWINLAEDYDIEWLAYLIGRFVKDDDGSRYEVTKIYFPPQVATGGHVEVDDDYDSYQPNTIGAVHSHVKMGVFFSQEDLRHSNWPVEIVVNAKGEGKVMVRQQLECGRYAKNYSEILTTGDQADTRYQSALDKAFEAGDRLRDARVKVKQDKVGYRTPEVSNHNYPHYQPDHNLTVFKESLRPSDSGEWPFRINGKPHRWDVGRNDYREIIKVNGQWIDKEDHEVEMSKVVAVTDGHGDDSDLHPIGEIVIDEATGQILVEGERSQAEIDAGMEAAVDANSCDECGGTGKVDSQGVKVECAACAGSGLKMEYFRGMGDGYGYTC